MKQHKKYFGPVPWWDRPVTMGAVYYAIVAYSHLLPIDWVGEFVWRVQNAVDEADRVRWRRVAQGEMSEERRQEFDRAYREHCRESVA